VRDIEPLRGMSIRTLHLSNLQLTDIGSLRGMPIINLILRGSPNLTNLEPLRGMPLVKLDLIGSGVRDVSILADFPALEEIVLPDKATNVERLRTLPKLRYLAPHGNIYGNEHPVQTAEEFWKEYDAKQAAGKK
jgi:hypothetical protein